MEILEKQVVANFKTICDLLARSAGFDSQVVPPKNYILITAK
jgi:hypothetical protein